MEAQVKEQNLPNVKLLPYQPRGRVPEIYATSDLCLVPLMAGTAKTTVPSKLFTIMASGRPALVAVDEDSDIVQSVINAKCGLAVKPDDADALMQGIRQAFENREEFRQFGQNGRQYVVQHLSRQAVSDQYHDLMLRLTNSHE